jgi:hypothetical protein
MNEIADCLDAWPTGGRFPEEGPGFLGKPIGFAVTAPEQKHQCFRRQILHGVLCSGKVDPVRQTAVVDERVGGDPDITRRRDDTAAPVAEAVALGGERGRRGGDDVVCDDEIGNAGEMDIQHQNHGCRLRTLID